MYLKEEDLIKCLEGHKGNFVSYKDNNGIEQVPLVHKGKSFVVKLSEVKRVVGK